MRYLGLLLAATLMLASPSTAWASEACSCGLITDPLGFDPTAVPTNAKLFITADRDRTTLSLAKIVNDLPEPIAFHFEDVAEGTGEGWMIPDAPLEPMTTYEFVRGELHRPFTTGAGADTMAPTFASATIKPWALSGACEQHIGATLIAEAGNDDTTTQSLWVWKVAVKSPAKTIYLAPGSNGVIGRMDIDDHSWDSCLSNYPAAELDKNFDATFVALDWAGNASKEVTTTFQFAEGGAGCGCHLAGGMTPPEKATWLLGALAISALRRRKR